MAIDGLDDLFSGPILCLMADTVIYRDRDHPTDRWVLVRDDEREYVCREHVGANVHLSGKPYVTEVVRWSIGDFLATGQPPHVKLALQKILESRANASRSQR